MILRDMEAMEETEALLEKIWDIHDKLSDAIHAISRSHFLKSVKSLKKSPGTVYTKDFHASDDESSIAEARSLSAIRSALENLEDQIEFFHTFKSLQWAERAAAIARLEQSRNVLAMRLAGHHGNKYKVIEEALAFVGNVKDNTHFVVPETMEDTHQNQSAENLVDNERKGPSLWVQAFVSSFSSAMKSLKLEHMGGILGHAALIAVSMLVFLQLHQVASKDDFVVEASQAEDDSCHMKRRVKNVSVLWGSPSVASVKHLDVLLARG